MASKQQHGGRGGPKSPAAPVAPVDPATLPRRVAIQIEFYFTDRNLVNDRFFREELAKSTEGCVPMASGRVGLAGAADPCVAGALTGSRARWSSWVAGLWGGALGVGVLAPGAPFGSHVLCAVAVGHALPSQDRYAVAPPTAPPPPPTVVPILGCAMFARCVECGVGCGRCGGWCSVAWGWGGSVVTAGYAVSPKAHHCVFVCVLMLCGQLAGLHGAAELQPGEVVDGQPGRCEGCPEDGGRGGGLRGRLVLQLLVLLLCDRAATSLRGRAAATAHVCASVCLHPCVCVCACVWGVAV
jgi:hypothetical protein